MGSIIKFINASKRYKLGDQTISAIDNINILVNQGEFISIVGPSGSGKSTIMNIIGGLDKLTDGSVIVDGYEISKLTDRAKSEYRNKKIGFIFQNFNLDNTLSALENVEMPLFYDGVRKVERQAISKDALAIVGLEGRMNHRPSEMSGGQRQRVAVARAIVNSPKILLADEPTGNLDRKSGLMIFNLLRKINNAGVTVVMVTHNHRQAERTDRIVEISDGHVISDVYTK